MTKVDVGSDHDVALDLLRRTIAPAPGPITEALALVNGAVSTADTGKGQDQAHLLAALTVLRGLREELASWEPRLITAARDRGASWVSLAPALGVTSRQAAERRYLRLRPSPTGEATGESRVRAERDKRAGDRAVEEWARRNSAVLRQLAGQVSGLDGLSGPARRHADLVGAALADDDAATLLAPLADSQSHLRHSHAGLAEQIRSLTEQIKALRRHSSTGRAGGKSPRTGV
jgi:hypothetical protein